MKLNEQATFWLDSWVGRKTNTNEMARVNAKAIVLHIAALQAALARYGDHDEDCNARNERTWNSCTCGFGDAYDKPTASIKAGEED